MADLNDILDRRSLADRCDPEKKSSRQKGFLGPLQRVSWSMRTIKKRMGDYRRLIENYKDSKGIYPR